MASRIDLKLGGQLLGLISLGCVVALIATGARAQEDRPEPKRGGTLVYLEQQAHTVLYPPAGGFYPNGGVLNQITDKLTYQNPQTLEIEPWLAESWEINDDSTVYTFHLRPGVTFSDHTPVDAAAVAANFDAYGLGNREHNFPVSEVVNNYQRSEVVDDLTVRFYFSAPSPGFLQGTSVIGSGLVARSTLAHDFAELGDATLIIGSGPFVVERETTGTELVLKAREDYDWGPAHHPHQGRALLDGVRYVIVPEDGVRIGALLSGQADVVRQIQAYDEGQISGRGFALYAPATRGVNNTLILRPDNQILADRRVRQALQLATPREEIVETLFSAHYPVATSTLAATAQGYVDLADKLRYDPQRAAALLDEAGWRLGAAGLREHEGRPLELTVYESLPQPQSRATLSLIAQRWADLGIKLNVLSGDAGSRVADELDPQKTGLLHSMVGRADPDVLKSHYHYQNRNVLLQTGGISDKVKSFHDDELNGLLERIAVENDPQRRLALVGEVQRYVLDAAYAIPIFEEPQVYGAAPYVKDLGFEAVGRPSFYATWLDK